MPGLEAPVGSVVPTGGAESAQEGEQGDTGSRARLGAQPSVQSWLHRNLGQTLNFSEPQFPPSAKRN